MTIRRIRLSRLLKLVPLLLCLFALYLIGSYIAGSSNQPVFRDEFQQIDQEEHHLNEFYTDPEKNAMKFQERSSTAKKNLIIVSHGRSGSTLMGDIFNHHPSVFYMYEPLQTVERVSPATLGTSKNYNERAMEFLTGIFRCSFDSPQMLADIEKFYRKPAHPRVSHAIASPPLCPYLTTDLRWDPSLCAPMTSESLGSACKEHYDLTVIKVLISRIPENSIKSILASCMPEDVDCKVILLVRDPRAVIASALSVGFFTEQKGDSKVGTRRFSYLNCKETEHNLDFVRKLPESLRNRIRFQRYEDLALNPLKELSGLYKFAGLSVPESVRTWLNETTRQSRGACNHKEDGEQATCTKDDAWAAANRWRWKVHPHEIDLIEHYCRHVMALMGYKPVDRSYELLANVETPLFSDDYEAKHWFLH